MPDNRDREDEGVNGELGTRITRKTSTETSSGAEATKGMEGRPEGESHRHRSAYGGDGGEPREPNDFPRSRR